MLSRLVISLGLIAGLSPAAGLAAERPVVVELFTSQGPDRRCMPKKIKPRSPRATRRWPFCCQVDQPRTGYAARRTSFNATLSFAFRFLTR